MLPLFKDCSLRCLLALLAFPLPFLAFSQQPQPTYPATQPLTSEWTSAHAEHLFGFAEVKAADKGALSITATDLSFAGKTGRVSIPLTSILAVSAGNERVELWGIKGQLLRMAMPNGSGLLAATVMHHRVDLLTIEFVGPHNGYHAAVFLLPANEADRAVKILSAAPITHHDPASNACHSSQPQSKTIRIPLPAWNNINVPPAYRALVYEHIVEELRKSSQFDRVYRDGEEDEHGGCPQYTAQFSIKNFKAGNQVERAAMGPIGMFVGTTQILFDVKVSDAQGRMLFNDQIKSTTRGESESTGIAKAVAKKFSKKLAESRKHDAAPAPGGAPQSI